MDDARYTACPGCQRLIREARAHAKTSGSHKAAAAETHSSTGDRATTITITKDIGTTN